MSNDKKEEVQKPDAKQKAPRKDSFFDQERIPHEEFRRGKKPSKIHTHTDSESSEDEWYLPTPPPSPSAKPK